MWPATPRRQGDRQLSSPPASASAPSRPPANVKTVELAKTILTYTNRACGVGEVRQNRSKFSVHWSKGNMHSLFCFYFLSSDVEYYISDAKYSAEVCTWGEMSLGGVVVSVLRVARHMHDAE